MQVKQMMCCAAISMAAGLAFTQGVLVPPGAPESTMKTLSEIDTAIAGVSAAVEKTEPRIDLSTVAGNSTYRHVITEPGSYYLSKNLELTNWSRAIYVNAQGVTIDLNGFEISRTTPGIYGIYGDNQSYNLCVRNGSIRNFEYGVDAYGSHSRFEDLTISECTEVGLYAYNPSIIVNCRAYNNTGIGFKSPNSVTMTGCIATGNQGNNGIQVGDGSVLSDCVAIGNANYGFYIEKNSLLTRCVAKGNDNFGFHTLSGCTLQQCVARMNAIGFYLRSGCVVSDCVAMANERQGFLGGGDTWDEKGCQLLGCVAQGNGLGGFDAGDGSILENCSAFGNNGSTGDSAAGIAAGDRSIVQGCISSLNDFGTSESAGISVGESSSVRDSMTWQNTSIYSPVSSSQAAGIIAGKDSTVKDCSISENKGDGIQIKDNSVVIGNLIHASGYGGGTSSGIYVEQSGSRIEGNQVIDNDYGIHALYADTVLIKNIASGSSIKNYNFSGQQFKGSTVTNLTTITTLDAWANFEY